MQFVTASTDQPSGPTPEPSPGPSNLRSVETPASPEQPSWQTQAIAVRDWLTERFSHPRVRLGVTGVVLILLGGLGAIDSMWTLPLVIVGAVMVVVAWIGSRLNGRFAIEWGDSGTQLEFRARIDSPLVTQTALPAAQPSPGPARPAIWIPERAEEPAPSPR